MSVNKTIKRMLAAEARRAQKERPSLFERAPEKVNRSATRMNPKVRKETRGAAKRRFSQDD